MAAMDSRLIDFASTESTSPILPCQIVGDAPRHRRSPTQVSFEARSRRQERHSKKLSLSFPILVPTRGTDTPNSHYSASPIAVSANPSSHDSLSPSPSANIIDPPAPPSNSLSMPLTPPSERSEDDPSQTITMTGTRVRGTSVPVHTRQESNSSKFLTMLASQERRVLELKEELSRAETELTTLKKQWALYEANKKKDEARGTAQKMGPVTTSHGRAASVVERATGLGLVGLQHSIDEHNPEAEREKRREIARERMMGRWTSLENGQNSSNNSKKTGQRVFSGSKHTRALSLLTTSANTRTERTGSLDSFGNAKPSIASSRKASTDASTMFTTTAPPSMPSLSRSNSGLDGLNFGKTYKDLAHAASRKNLPPGLSPEQLVKHSKIVVDGVRDGLWTFFEDIRQATVGDEAVNGSLSSVSRQNSMRQQGSTKLKRTASERKTRSAGTEKSSTEDRDSSFWKEFGMDTPKSDKVKKETSDRRPGLPGRWPSTKTGTDFTDHYCARHDHEHDETFDTTATDPISPKKKRSEGAEHHESKSSTDSRHPPSLLADLLDEEDESWDHWESNTDQDPNSPQLQRRGHGAHKKTFSVEKTKDVHWQDLMS